MVFRSRNEISRDSYVSGGVTLIVKSDKSTIDYVIKAICL